MRWRNLIAKGAKQQHSTVVCSSRVKSTNNTHTNTNFSGKRKFYTHFHIFYLLFYIHPRKKKKQKEERMKRKTTEDKNWCTMEKRTQNNNYKRQIKEKQHSIVFAPCIEWANEWERGREAMIASMCVYRVVEYEHFWIQLRLWWKCTHMVFYPHLAIAYSVHLRISTHVCASRRMKENE